jgi:hypothetical protein
MPLTPYKVFNFFKAKGLYGGMYFLQLLRRGLYGRGAGGICAGAVRAGPAPPLLSGNPEWGTGRNSKRQNHFKNSQYNNFFKILTFPRAVM